jgi:hypothetical protein
VSVTTSDTRSRLGSALHRYIAYHHEGMKPWTHLGLPSPSITVVLSVGADEGVRFFQASGTDDGASSAA